MRKLLIALILLSAQAFGAAFRASSGGVGSGTTSPVSFTAGNSTNGDVFVLYVATIGASPVIATPTITGGGTFRLYNTCGTDPMVQVWVATVTTQTGPTVSVAITGTWTSAVIAGGEYSSAAKVGGMYCHSGSGTSAADTVLTINSSSSLVTWGLSASGNTTCSSATTGTLRQNAQQGTAMCGAYGDHTTSGMAITLGTSSTWQLAGLVVENADATQVSGRMVQGNVCASAALPSNGLQCPFNSDVTANNLIGVASANATASLTYTIADSQSQTYNAGKNSSGNSITADIQYAKNVAAGNTVVKVTPSGGTATKVFVGEWNSEDTTTPLDGTGGAATGSSTTPSVSVTNVATNALLLGNCRTSNSTTINTATTTWVKRNRSSAAASWTVDDVVVTSAAARTYDGTQTNGTWTCAAVSFKDASQPSTTVPRHPGGWIR